MKKLYFVLLLLGGIYYAYEQSQVVPSPERAGATVARASAATFDRRHSGRMVQAEGSVSRILSDDNDGSRHQRFILR